MTSNTAGLESLVRFGDGVVWMIKDFFGLAPCPDDWSPLLMCPAGYIWGLLIVLIISVIVLLDKYLDKKEV